MRALMTRPIAGWVLYDFANTIFSYAVITRYLNDWVVVQRGAPDILMGLMGLVVSVCLVISMPLMGLWADRHGARKPFLAAFTALCVTATALLGLVSWLPAVLVLAGIAVFAFNSALAHYDPLLQTVAPAHLRPTVSGLGVGVGYLGTMVALLVLGSMVGDDNQAAFGPTALMFALAALPCLVWVRERRTPSTAAATVGLRDSGRLLSASLRAARRDGYGRFLVARFLYVDGVATVIAFMTVYAQRVGGLSDGQVDQLLALSIGTAVAGAIGAGLLARRLGAKTVLFGVLTLAVVTLTVGALSGSATALWVMGPMVGVVLGALNTCDRLVMLALAPAGRQGEAFGVYALVGKLSSGVGPFVLWGGTIFVLHDRLGALSQSDATRIAVLALAGAVAAGMWVLRGVQVPDTGKLARS